MSEESKNQSTTTKIESSPEQMDSSPICDDQQTAENTPEIDLERFIAKRREEAGFEVFVVRWLECRLAKKRFPVRLKSTDGTVYFKKLSRKSAEVLMRAMSNDECDPIAARACLCIAGYKDRSGGASFRLLPVSEIAFDAAKYSTPVPQLLQWLKERFGETVWNEVLSEFQKFQANLDRMSDEIASNRLLYGKPLLRCFVAAHLAGMPDKLKLLHYSFNIARDFYLDTILLAITGALGPNIVGTVQTLYDRLHPGASEIPIEKLEMLLRCMEEDRNRP